MNDWPFPVSSRKPEPPPEPVPCVCPVCQGVGRVVYEGGIAPNVLDMCSWYDKETNTQECSNCRCTTPGRSLLRADGQPCVHDYEHHLLGNCYHGYTCRHCPSSYTIDSGD